MTTPVDRLTAALVGRYEIEREIGQGGMATVYLAQDIRHDRKVAVKVLRPELSAILGAERFLKEIRLTANLQHPHILPLHDSGTADGTVFYVMPYVEGESLRQRITRDKQLPIDDAVRIAREVASALDYAHRHGVVHRDIKPENILLHDGQALVADFGIALAVSSAGGGTRMTETGMSLGTPHYMSPEQAMGEREITAKSDVYALGCVLYEMLVGEPPFTGPTAQAIIARVVTEEPRSLRLQRKTIPENVEAAVNTALSKMPADRFSTAAQFADALARSEYAPPATQATRSRPAARGLRHRAVAALPWVLFGAALIVGAFSWMRTAEPVVTRNRIMLWQASTPTTIAGRFLALSPDGRGIAFVDTVGGRQQIWLKERHRLDAVIVAGTVGAFGLTFSPDGEWLAFAADGKLKKVPRLGGSPITLSDSAAQAPPTAWLADGTILFTNPNSELLAIDEDGGTHRRVFTSNPEERGVVAVSALPGGRAALIATCQPGCPDADLRALDLETGKANILASDALNGWYLDGQIVFIRRDGGAFAARFDLGKLAFSSPPIPVLDGVRTGLIVADMAVSPNGTLVYIPGAAQAGATVAPVWVTRSGAVSVVDSSWSYVSPANWGISLSPDGRLLAVGARVAGTDDIWIKELQGGVLRRLTFEGSNARPVAWTRGGGSIIFTSVNRGNSDLRIRRADGTGADAVFADTRNPIFEAVVTPDSARIIVRTGGSPSRDIMLLRLGDSTAAGLVASDQYQEVGPALSRDGRWLAYASDETGRYEIYVRPFPDVNAGKWQISRNGGSEPFWARNGRELFFRDGAANMVSAAVVTSPTFSSGEQSILFSTRGLRTFAVARGYDVTPDDNRFAFTRIIGTGENDAALPVVLVENWGAEIRKATRRGQ